MLSLVTFLWRMFRHYEAREENMNVVIHCDNESVIKVTANLNDADADKDVFLQLQFVLQALKHCLTIEFLHVKGHQKLDDNSP